MKTARFGDHTISLCPRGDAAELQRFIDEHWRKGHPLAHDRALLDWQFLNASEDRYDVVLSRDADGRISGMQGFVTTGHFDPALDSDNEAWLSIWKVRSDVKAAGLGLRLMMFTLGLRSWRSVSAFGVVPAVLPLYQYLDFVTGRMDHFVFLHPSKRDFRLVLGAPAGRPVPRGAKRLTPDAPGESLPFPAARPVKSRPYLEKRYFAHPVYRYEARLIRSGDTVEGLLVFRVIEQDGARCLRIVDLIGPAETLTGLGGALAGLLEEKDAEYADLYSHGLSRDAVLAAGFLDRHAPGNDGLVVPNYFEPFERKNIDLHYCIFGDRNGFRLVKGDADQDRPSQMRP